MDPMFRTSAEADDERLGQENRFRHPTSSNLLLIAARRYFCGGFLMLHVFMFMCIWFLAFWAPEKELVIILPVLFCLTIRNRQEVKIKVTAVFNGGS